MDDANATCRRLIGSTVLLLVGCASRKAPPPAPPLQPLARLALLPTSQLAPPGKYIPFAERYGPSHARYREGAGRDVARAITALAFDPAGELDERALP
jgi:hypothetical protein